MEQVRLDYERDLDVLERAAAGGPFLAGEEPGIFDFAVYGLLRTMEGLAGEELLAKRPKLAAWYVRVKELPPGAPPRSV
jgi:glutathione S-transferase